MSHLFFFFFSAEGSLIQHFNSIWHHPRFSCDASFHKKWLLDDVWKIVFWSQKSHNDSALKTIAQKHHRHCGFLYSNRSRAVPGPTCCFIGSSWESSWPSFRWKENLQPRKQSCRKDQNEISEELSVKWFCHVRRGVSNQGSMRPALKKNKIDSMINAGKCKQKVKTHLYYFWKKNANNNKFYFLHTCHEHVGSNKSLQCTLTGSGVWKTNPRARHNTVQHRSPGILWTLRHLF